VWNETASAVGATGHFAGDVSESIGHQAAQYFRATASEAIGECL